MSLWRYSSWGGQQRTAVYEAGRRQRLADIAPQVQQALLGVLQTARDLGDRLSSAQRQAFAGETPAGYAAPPNRLAGLQGLGGLTPEQGVRLRFLRDQLDKLGISAEQFASANAPGYHAPEDQALRESVISGLPASIQGPPKEPFVAEPPQFEPGSPPLAPGLTTEHLTGGQVSRIQEQQGPSPFTSFVPQPISEQLGRIPYAGRALENVAEQINPVNVGLAAFAPETFGAKVLAPLLAGQVAGGTIGAATGLPGAEPTGEIIGGLAGGITPSLRAAVRNAFLRRTVEELAPEAVRGARTEPFIAEHLADVPDEFATHVTGRAPVEVPAPSPSARVPGPSPVAGRIAEAGLPPGAVEDVVPSAAPLVETQPAPGSEAANRAIERANSTRRMAKEIPGLAESSTTASTGPSLADSQFNIQWRVRQVGLRETGAIYELTLATGQQKVGTAQEIAEWMHDNMGGIARHKKLFAEGGLPVPETGEEMLARGARFSEIDAARQSKPGYFESSVPLAAEIGAAPAASRAQPSPISEAAQPSTAALKPTVATTEAGQRGQRGLEDMASRPATEALPESAAAPAGEAARDLNLSPEEMQAVVHEVRSELPQMTAGGGPGTPRVPLNVAPLLPFDQVVSGIKTSDSALGRAVVKRLGLNPAIDLTRDDIGKSIIAYWKQRIAGEQLSELATATSVDVHAQPVTGMRSNFIIPNAGANKGLVKNVTPLEPGASLDWHDVYSEPGRYKLTPAQQAEIADYHRVTDEVEAMRQQAGLPARATNGPVAVREGWLYTPRQVKGIRGVELQRPSNASLQRVYEDAAEARAHGIEYDSPRPTLAIHTRNAYREIADKQFSDHIEMLNAKSIADGKGSIFVTAKGLIPKSVLKQISDATLSRLAAERQLRQLRFEQFRLRTAQARELGSQRVSVQRAQTGLAGTQDVSAAGEKLSQLEAQRTALGELRTGQRTARGNLTARIRSAQANVDVQKATFNLAKGRYSKALETARRAEVAKGSLFGIADDTIPIMQWRNRFFPRERGEMLKEGIDKFFGRQQGSPLTQAVYTLGNYRRFLASVGDFAMPLQQGQPVLAVNPKAWAEMTAKHYQAFFDPTVQARAMRDFLPEFQEMAQHGTPIGDPEFFLALREGGGLSLGKLLKMLPKGEEFQQVLHHAGRQSFGRFEASYNTGLGMSRALLVSALKDAIPDAAERQEMIRNLTGGLDSRALGVKPGQRAVEGFWGSFSPRLLRSTAAVVSNVRYGPLDPRGRAALTALTRLGTGAAMIYVLTGLALGKNWDEIKTGLNPLNGKKFLSHQINGDWIGIGGQYRSIAQLIAQVVARPPDVQKVTVNLAKGRYSKALETARRANLASLSPRDNPLISFWGSRGAPARDIVGGAIEAASGGKADFVPLHRIDNPIDYVKFLGSSSFPFVVQNVFENQHLAALTSSLVGFRTSAQTRTERQGFRLQDYLDIPAYKGLDAGDQAKVEDFLSQLRSDRTDWQNAHPGREIEPLADSVDRLAPQRLRDPKLVRWAGVLADRGKADRNRSPERDQFILDHWDVFVRQYPRLITKRLRALRAKQR